MVNWQKFLIKPALQNYLVEVGGELVSKGKKPEAKAWRVAIEKPLPDSQKLQKIISVQQSEPLSIMTSGTYRHFYDQDGVRYSHVLDARTGTAGHSRYSINHYSDSGSNLGRCLVYRFFMHGQ